eukprot:97108_1
MAAESKSTETDLDTLFEEKTNDKVKADNATWLTAAVINEKWKKAFGENKQAVLPVIHVANPSHSGKSAMEGIEKNITLILKYKFHGCFLINHGFRPTLLVPIIQAVRATYPNLWIGANFLGCIGDEFDFMHKHKLLNVLDGLWIDDGGIYYSYRSQDQSIVSQGGSNRLKKYKKYQWNGLYFGGIDFKYKKQINKNDYKNVSDYIEKCKHLGQFVSLNRFMDCICTTGKGTGKAADVEKIKAFKDGCDTNGSKLSIASGVTPQNVHNYLPFVDAILVATGISQDFHNFSEVKMKAMRDVLDNYNQQK